MRPSTWKIAGDAARTVFTAMMFQSSAVAADPSEAPCAFRRRAGECRDGDDNARSQSGQSQRSGSRWFHSKRSLVVDSARSIDLASSWVARRLGSANRSKSTTCCNSARSAWEVPGE